MTDILLLLKEKSLVSTLVKNTRTFLKEFRNTKYDRDSVLDFFGALLPTDNLWNKLMGYIHNEIIAPKGQGEERVGMSKTSLREDSFYCTLVET